MLNKAAPRLDSQSCYHKKEQISCNTHIRVDVAIPWVCFEILKLNIQRILWELMYMEKAPHID